MTTPNEMPKNNNKLQQQALLGLIALAPATWERKTLVKDEDGKETVETKRVVRSVLRNALAKNVSEENVERAAKRWMR